MFTGYYEWLGATEEQLRDARTRAENGDAEAQFFMARLYFNGDFFLNIKENSYVGMEWLLKAVKQEYADAMFLYGMMLYKGDRVKKDYELALTYVGAAARQGPESAQINMVMMLLDKDNPYYSEERAADWKKTVDEMLKSEGLIDDTYDRISDCDYSATT